MIKMRNSARRCSTIVAIIALANACARNRDRESARDTLAANDPTRRDAPSVVISSVADSAIVRSVGVPTDRDDTIGTKYGKHQAPRPVAAPGCLPSGIALCILDTARTFRSGVVESGGVPDAHETAWLVFAAAQDSMQLFLVASSYSHLVMEPRSAAGFFAEHADNDASWIRARFPRAGSHVFTASISSDTSINYQLRLAPVIATGASRPIGASATLTIVSDSSARIAIAPASMASALGGAGYDRFAIPPATYRVVLVRDTSYVACRLPCTKRLSFTLRPRQTVSLTP
jgi:hypothetical protein